MSFPPFNDFPTLIGDKILLRQILPDDVGDLIEISFYDGIHASTVQQAIEMQRKINQDYADGNSMHWGIVNKETNKMVGTCGYYRGFENGAGEIGCVLLPQYHGQGFMSLAILLAIDFGLNKMELKRIWAETSDQNHSAKKLFERLNFAKTAELDDDAIVYDLRQ